MVGKKRYDHLPEVLTVVEHIINCYLLNTNGQKKLQKILWDKKVHVNAEKEI